MPRRGIKDDRQTPLQVIRQDLRGSIPSELVKIQNYKLRTEDKWSHYVENLPCVIRPAAGQRELKRRRIDASDDQNYAAVSYRWDASEWEDGKKGRYRCKPLGAEGLEDCPIRDQVIDRVTQFLDSVGCELFWIDQICLNQSDGIQRKIQMQSMHAVYRQSKYPVAIVSTPIQSLEEMELLAALMDGSLLKYCFKTDAAIVALALINKLTNDPWWSSAWTYEEDHCAAGMTLLIPHSPSLNGLRHTSRMEYLFGCLKNQLCVSSMYFRTGVNRFCTKFMAVYLERDYDKKECQRILRVAPKYNTILRDEDNETRVSMSPYILADLAKRHIKHFTDSPTVASNCCDYPIVIDVDSMKEDTDADPTDDEWSLSLIMLAQYVLNGEILSNFPDRRYSLNASVFEYLKKQSLKTYRSPIDCKPLTFIKSARLLVMGLAEDGIMTRGRLWQLSEKIFEVQTEGASCGWEKSSENGLNGYYRKRLKDLKAAVKNGDFGYCYPQLVSDIGQYLDKDKSQGRPIPPSKLYMDAMAVQLVNAMDEGTPLRLGRLVNEDDRNPSSYRGIFIWDPDMANDEDYAFTSFAEGGKCWKDIQRHVSIGVHVDEDGHLYTRNWLNGLIFTWGENTSNFLFPWPPALAG